MINYGYLFRNFFTHKDFLPPADQLPGTLFTPMSFMFEAVVLLIILSGAKYLASHKKQIRSVLTCLLVMLVVLEGCIISWDSLAGATKGLDLAVDLSLYPCSIFMYALPMYLWGHGIVKKMGCGYICTLGLLGALINFLYPISRLADYSCISFPAFHTFFFHGSMLFACLVLLLSGEHSYASVNVWWEIFLASVPGLLISIPANIINYSPIHADYMYFTGQHFIVANVFGPVGPLRTTVYMYLVYLLVPAAFYLPAWLAKNIRNRGGALLAG